MKTVLQSCLRIAQIRSWAWCRNAFGQAVTSHVTERACRIVEEAIELGQAEGMTEDDVLRLVRRVYSRPVGDPWQELGGTMHTLLVYAQAKGVNIGQAFEDEISRVERKLDEDPEHFRRKHQEKFDAGVCGLPPEPMS